MQERIARRARNAPNYGYQKTFFAGLVKCGKCGYACNHVHHHGAKVEYNHIECNRRKDKECDLLPIREDELKEAMTEAVGTHDKLEKILLYDDHIDFYLDGKRVKTVSRSFPRNSHHRGCFSRRTVCGECGGSVIRLNCCGGKGWGCNVRKHNRHACSNRMLKEPELIEAAKWAIGTDENYEMRYYCDVEKAVVYRD